MTRRVIRAGSSFAYPPILLKRAEYFARFAINSVWHKFKRNSLRNGCDMSWNGYIMYAKKTGVVVTTEDYKLVPTFTRDKDLQARPAEQAIASSLQHWLPTTRLRWRMV